MNLTLLMLLCLFVFLISFVFIGFWQWKLRLLSIVDKPNTRSSHSHPTPRGGGLGIYLSFLIGLSILSYITKIYELNDLIFIIGASLVFWIGLLDDFKHTKKRWRFSVHIVSAILGFIWLKDSMNQWLDGILVYSNFYPVIYMIWIISLVWSVNLFNFMDGINGIAGMETIFVCSIFSLLLYIKDPNSFRYMQTGLLIFSTLGFLLWNFPRAFIFLGDCGSGFIGYTLFSIGSWMVYNNFIEVSSFLILTSLFWVDASITLMFRFCNRENIFIAHNRHCYQILSRIWKSHSLVTIVYLCINIFVILPLIFWIESGYSYSWILIFIFILSLTVFNLYFHILEKRKFVP